MFTSTRKKFKTVFSITDERISVITLAKDRSGFFVHNHRSLKIPEGTILRGEVLKAEVFSRLLRKIAETIPQKENVDVLLPYEHFMYGGAQLDKASRKKNLKKRIRDYFKNTPQREPWHNTHVCEYSYHPEAGGEYVVFRCLPQDIFQSYFFLFQNAGFRIQNVTSDILSFDHVFDAERTRVLFVGEQSTRLVEYMHGMFTQSKAFEFSYTQLVRDIASLTRMTKQDAEKVLDKYGLLRSHPDEKVYKKLTRSLGPLLELLQKKKVNNGSDIFLIFEKTPIKGMSDIIEKTTKLSTTDFDILKQKKYQFHEVLSIHKKKLIGYYPHIAQALKSFKK